MPELRGASFSVRSPRRLSQITACLRYVSGDSQASGDELGPLESLNNIPWIFLFLLHDKGMIESSEKVARVTRVPNPLQRTDRFQTGAHC